jgi:hypothetical protein
MSPRGGEHFIRIRKKLTQRRRYIGKPNYKGHRLELTIPARYEDVVEPFMHKDLKVEVKSVGDKVIIKARPVENTT